jgi:hypothetical protein
MRAWALSDGDVADALARLDQMRFGFITELLNDLGVGVGVGASRFARSSMRPTSGWTIWRPAGTLMRPQGLLCCTT